MESKLISRILTAIVLLPIALGYAFISNPVVILPIYLLGMLIMCYELHRLALDHNPKSKLEKVTCTISYGFVFLGGAVSGYEFVYGLNGTIRGLAIEEFLLYLMMIEFLLIGLIQVFFFKNFTNPFKNQQAYLFVFFYLNFIFFHLLKLKYFFIHHDSNLVGLGNYYILLSFLICWFYDSFAFIFGKKWGSKKIGLKVSEQKSWVGLIAGLLSTFLAGIIVSGLLANINPSLWENSIFAEGAVVFLLFLFLGLIAQLGDLMASLHKRSSGMKDSGTIMKGHGGFYDRNDSLILVVLVVYYVLVFYHRGIF